MTLEAGQGRQPGNNVRSGCLLKHDEIDVGLPNDPGNQFLAAHSAALDVV
jgi:hypothetical protein